MRFEDPIRRNRNRNKITREKEYVSRLNLLKKHFAKGKKNEKVLQNNNNKNKKTESIEQQSMNVQTIVQPTSEENMNVQKVNTIINNIQDTANKKRNISSGNKEIVYFKNTDQPKKIKKLFNNYTTTIPDMYVKCFMIDYNLLLNTNQTLNEEIFQMNTNKVFIIIYDEKYKNELEYLKITYHDKVYFSKNYRPSDQLQDCINEMNNEGKQITQNNILFLTYDCKFARSNGINCIELYNSTDVVDILKEYIFRQDQIDSILNKLRLSNIKMLAIDFDDTITDIHTYEDTTVETIEKQIRPFFKDFISTAIKKGFIVAVVTFSVYTGKIREVLDSVFGKNTIILRGLDGTWNYEMPNRLGKSQHIYDILFFLTETKIDLQNVLLIDDDINNTNIGGYNTIHFNTNKPLSVFIKKIYDKF